MLPFPVHGVVVVFGRHETHRARPEPDADTDAEDDDAARFEHLQLFQWIFVRAVISVGQNDNHLQSHHTFLSLKRWLQLRFDLCATTVRPRYYIRQNRRHCGLNKLCAWRNNMPPPPCKLTISSYLFPVSEMAYTVSSGTLNSTIVYHTIPFLFNRQVAPVPACWLFKTSATS